MTLEDIEKIYSNDYADFIIEYNGDMSLLEKYIDGPTQILNFFLAVVHRPIRTMTYDAVSKIGYSKIPTIFSLSSEASIDASEIDRVRSMPNLDLRGEGVLIGIVDSGIDYTNPLFQYADKTTRIACIWDQSVPNDKIVEGINFGTEYSREDINRALNSENPLSEVPSVDEIGHGTMIAGIAAGNEVAESGFNGVATDAELVVVKLKPAKSYLKEFFRIPQTAVSYQENDVIAGVQYLLHYARKVSKPIAICISTDTSQYAHDGRGTTSNWLSLMANLSGIAIIIPVGNEGNKRRHYRGEINKDKKADTIELNVGPEDKGFSMELWGTSPNKYWIDITTPFGEYIPRIDINLAETQKISFIFEPTVIYVDYQMIESQSGDQLILLRFSNTSQGIWKFNVYSIGVFPISYNVWLPMNNYISDATYFSQSNPNVSLLSVSCAIIPLTVTAYNVEDKSLYYNAGKGYTRIQIVKPEIAAPGVNIIAPSLNHGFVQVTGTSAAAAHTTGVAAMLLEWGIIKGNYPKMSTTDMKIFMIRGAKRDPDKIYPNKDWGYGILDVYSIFDRLRRV